MHGKKCEKWQVSVTACDSAADGHTGPWCLWVRINGPEGASVIVLPLSPAFHGHSRGQNEASCLQLELFVGLGCCGEIELSGPHE